MLWFKPEKEEKIKLTDKWDHKQMTSLFCYTVDTNKFIPDGFLV